jgi:hypothetical protein
MEATHETREGYLDVRTTGKFCLGKAEELLLDWIETARSAGRKRILCDMTAVTSFNDELALTLVQYEAAKFVAEALPADFRLAFLQNTNQLQEDHFGENVMRAKGAAVRVTSSRQEALEWLTLPRCTAPPENASSKDPRLALQVEYPAPTHAGDGEPE